MAKGGSVVASALLGGPYNAAMAEEEQPPVTGRSVFLPLPRLAEGLLLPLFLYALPSVLRLSLIVP